MNAKLTHEKNLLERHTPLVSSVVSQFAPRQPQVFSADHLHGLGLIALLDAARRYPPASSVSFETFARIQIQNTFTEEIRRAKNWFNDVPPAMSQTPLLS